MPHLRNGDPAAVGDVVRGKPYNTKDADGNPREIVGTIVSITPSAESCNCTVAWIEELDLAKIYDGANVGVLVQSNAADKAKHAYTIKTDYGETKIFEKVIWS
jgi:hypothetical protein